MKDSKYAAKMQIITCRAHSDIQKRDLVFKEHNKHRFRIFKLKSNCNKLLDENNLTTSNPPTILKLFQSQ